MVVAVVVVAAVVEGGNAPTVAAFDDVSAGRTLDLRAKDAWDKSNVMFRLTLDSVTYTHP